MSRWRSEGRTPLQQVDFECKETYEREQQFRRSEQILGSIARRAALNDLQDWPLNLDTVDKRADWLVALVGNELSLTEAEKKAHRLDYQYLRPLIS